MINIFVLGKKGLDALSGLDIAQLGFVNALVIGRDSGVVEDYSHAIEAFAQARNMRYFFRTEVAPDVLSDARYNIAIGWRWLISLEIPLIVFHDSILPKYRGFNPLVSALINGDTKIGVTALFGTDEFDKGAIIAERIIDIQYPVKIATAIELLAKEYAVLLRETIEGIIAGTLSATPQDEAAASFSLWRDDEDYRIDWSLDSQTISRMINAVGFPYKGAFTMMEDMPVRIFDAQVVPDVTIVNRTPGKVLFKTNAGIVIVCGEGLLQVSEFFGENGNPIAVNKFRIRFK